MPASVSPEKLSSNYIKLLVVNYAITKYFTQRNNDCAPSPTFLASHCHPLQLQVVWVKLGETLADAVVQTRNTLHWIVLEREFPSLKYPIPCFNPYKDSVLFPKSE